MPKTLDLIIVGAGAAGFAAANAANTLKKRALLINDSSILPLGGTCVNVGCVPSKIMLHQAHTYFYALNNDFKSLALRGDADFVEALNVTREMVGGFREGNYVQVVESQPYIEHRDGRACFVDSNTVRVGDEEYESEHFLICTGAATFVPPIDGIGEIEFLTNENVFELSEMPESVVILGGGPQGMEFSQIFNHFGVRTTVLQRPGRLIPQFDALLGEELRKYLSEQGISIHTNADTREVRQSDDGVELLVDIDGVRKSLTAERVMLATGVRARTGQLQAARAGIDTDEKGFVKVNEYLQTSQDHIYAAGDVTGLMPLETTAAKQGHTAVLNMFEDAGKMINYNHVPHAVFTSPSVASVGITEEQYMEEHGHCLATTVSLDHVEKARATRDTRGLIRMVVVPETRVIIGVHIIGPMAADIITSATYAVTNKMTLEDIRDTVHIFPTLSEMVKKAAQSFEQDLDKMPCCVE